MAFQFASTSGSNPFFEPNKWIGTTPKHHIKNKSTTFLLNKELTFENDELWNSSGEHEDG